MMQDELIAYLDGECTADQASAIEQALTQDAALRTRLSDLVRQRFMLAEVCASNAGRGEVRPGSPSIRPTSSRRLRAAVRRPARRRPLVWLAAAAGLLVAISALLLAIPAAHRSAEVARLITSGTGVIRIHDGRDEGVGTDSGITAGDRLLVPPAVSAELRFHDGSTVAITGDSTVVVLPSSSERLHLERGALTATVLPQSTGAPFAISTDLALATVLGTRFSLTASRTLTELAVEHGQVRLSSRLGSDLVTVAAGEGARMSSDGRLTRLSPTTLPTTTPTPPAPTPTPAATGIALLPADPWPVASVGTDAGRGMPREVISISGQPFTQALRIATPSDLVADPRHTGEYAVRVRIPTIAAMRRGDALLATIWLRSGDTAPAQTRLVIEELASVPRQSLAAALMADQQWRRHDLPFTAISDADAGTCEAQLWLGRTGQVIELAGLTLTNHGAQALRTIAPAATYDGRSADARWRSAAAARIAHHRLAQVEVRVEDASGRPLPDAQIQVRALAPAIRFGSAVVAERLLGTSPDDQRYRQEFLRRFTIAVPENALKWPERARDPELGERAVAWLVAQGLPVRGHALVWPRRENLPADLRQGADDPLIIGERLDRHLQHTLAAFRGRLAAWDVVNDPYSADLLLTGDGHDHVRRWFLAAKSADPATPRFLNLYGVLDDGGADLRRQEFYLKLIGDLLASGTPIDGLGLQCHQDRNLTPPEWLGAIIERFAAFGLPIHVTEFDVDLDDDHLQADYTRDALTMFYSQPAVQAVLAWGFWAGDHHRPRAAMLRKDWTPSASGQPWVDLVQGTWSGAASATSDALGQCRITTVRGTLSLEAHHQGRSVRATITASAGETAVTLRVANP